MSDADEALESLRANFIGRKEHMKRAMSEVDKQLKLVDHLLGLQHRVEELEIENGNLQHRNEQLEAELRDALQS